MGTGLEVFSTESLTSVEKSWSRGWLLVKKVVRDTAGSYERYEQKEKSSSYFCRGGDIEVM